MQLYKFLKIRYNIISHIFEYNIIPISQNLRHKNSTPRSYRVRGMLFKDFCRKNLISALFYPYLLARINILLPEDCRVPCTQCVQVLPEAHRNSAQALIQDWPD